MINHSSLIYLTPTLLAHEGILAWLWIFLMPFEAIFNPLSGVNQFLESLVTWPKIIGNAIAIGQSDFPKPQGA